MAIINGYVKLPEGNRLALKETGSLVHEVCFVGGWVLWNWRNCRLRHPDTLGKRWLTFTVTVIFAGDLSLYIYKVSCKIRRSSS
jgi:uncharacterized Tic20 family protein